VLAVVATATVVSARFARAEDPREGRQAGQKSVKQAFIETLVGTWNVETTGRFAGKGRTAFAKGVGGTALLEDYEKTSAMGTYYAHGIYKVSDDDRTITVWRIDNYGAEVLKLAGPLKDTGYEVSGEAPGMGPVKITLEKKGDALIGKMSASGLEITSTYTKAR
jgi:hypothetical protein